MTIQTNITMPDHKVTRLTMIRRELKRALQSALIAALKSGLKDDADLRAHIAADPDVTRLMQRPDVYALVVQNFIWGFVELVDYVDGDIPREVTETIFSMTRDD